MESKTLENGDVDSDAQYFSKGMHDAESRDCRDDEDDICDSQMLTPAIQDKCLVNGKGGVKYFVDGEEDDWLRDGLLVLGCFSIYIINMSHLNVVSVLFLDLLDRFDTKASTLTAMLSVTGFAYCLSSQVIVNVVMPRVSIRSLLLTSSCVLSLSTLAIVVAPSLPVFIVISIIKFTAQGGAFVPAVTVVGRSFTRRKTLAVALSVLGSSVASIVIPPMARFLNNKYGFTGCFLILSGLEMNAIVASLLVQPRPSSRDAKPSHDLSTPCLKQPTEPTTRKRSFRLHLLKEVVDVSLLKNYLVILQLISFSLNNMCLFLPVYLPAHAEKTGISQTGAANLMTVAGLCDTSARILFGFLGDLKLALPSRVIAFASLYMGIVCHFVALFTDFGSLVFLAVSIGLLGLSSVSYNPNLAVELVGVDHMGKMLALSQLVSTVWFSIQYPIHGVMIEATGSFVLSYHYVGASLILGSLCLACEPLVRRLQRRNEMRAKQTF